MQPNSVLVKEFPALLNAAEGRRFFRQLRVDLTEAYRPQVVFDLSRVQHMTAQGVDLLVRCIHQIADRDGELKFAVASPPTQLVLELTQISAIAETYESLEEALASWKTPAPTASTQIEPATPPPPA